MNFSDRFLAIASSTTFSGNDPKRVAQTLREKGAIPEELLPFSDNIKTFNEYHSPNPLPSSLLKEGLKFLDKFEISYEWVTPTPENLMEELKYSPLGVAVEAWQEKDGLYYGGENPNHFTCLVGYLPGKHWIVYDSYPTTGGSYLKNLAWDYSFKIVMSYSLKKKEKKDSWLVELIRRLFGDLRGIPF